MSDIAVDARGDHLSVTDPDTGDDGAPLTGNNASFSCAANQLTLPPEGNPDMSTTVIPIPFTLFGDLIVEWRRLHNDHKACDEIRSWTLGPLADARTPADLEHLARTRPDELLHSLLVLHQDRDSRLAGRALLALMSPKLVRIMRFARVGHRYDWRAASEECAAATVTAFLDVIANFRPVAPEGLAGALFLRTLGHITAQNRSVVDIPVEHRTLLVLEPRSIALTDVDVDVDDSDAAMTRLLDWGVRTKIIRPRERLLIQRAYLTEGADLAVVAAENGMTYAALRQRLSRSVRAIRTAVHTEGGTTPTARSRYATSRAS